MKMSSKINIFDAAPYFVFDRKPIYSQICKHIIIVRVFSVQICSDSKATNQQNYIFGRNVDTKSITNIDNANKTEATKTIIEVLCNSDQVGHVTLCNNSSYDSSIYFIMFILFRFMHGWKDSNPHQRCWRPAFYH